MDQMILFIILILVNIETQTQQCIPIFWGNSTTSIIPQFQANAARLEATGAKARQTRYNVTLRSTTISMPYELIAGVTYIENYFDPTMLEFSVRVAPYTASFTVFIIVNVEASWTAVHIHYIATSRQDFRAGYFIPQNSELFYDRKYIPLRQVNVTHYFWERKWADLSQKAVVRAYISGVLYKERFLDIKIGLSTVDTNTGRIDIILHIGNQKASISTLYLSYIVYAHTNTLLIITFSQQIDVFKNNISYNSENTFIGISHLSSKNIKFFSSKNKILQNNSWKYNKSQEDAFMDAYRKEGIIIQFLQNKSRIQFDKNISYFISNCTELHNCIAIGGSIFTQKEHQKCILCQPHSQYDPVKELCVCLQNFVRNENNICIPFQYPCQKDEIQYQGKCFKLSTQIVLANCQIDRIYNISRNKCDCKPGYFSYKKEDGNQKCALNCTLNYRFDIKQQKCVCLPKIIDEHGNCIKCQALYSEWNPLTKNCECAIGYQMYSNECYKCSQSATFSSQTKKCICKQGYNGTGIFCKKN